jgi:alkylresorcinol/alkylpyrone synthase
VKEVIKITSPKGAQAAMTKKPRGKKDLHPKIISLGYALPTYRYTQREVFDLIGYPAHFWRIFAASQIDSRYFSIPLERARALTFQKQQEMYMKIAPNLASEALMRALDGRDADKLSLVCFSTCTGFPPGPTVGHAIAERFMLKPSTEINNMSSMGCEAAFPGIRRCYDFAVAHPGTLSAAISCELSSLTYFPEPDGQAAPENDYECLRAAAIFGDGCSCALIGYDDNPRHPEILDFVTHLETKYMDRLGYTWRSGRLRVRLCRDVPDIAVELLTKSITELLNRNTLKLSDIKYWVFHPPGAIVLDKLRDSMGIPEEKLKYSRKVLRMFGNMSSATVGVVAKTLVEEEKRPSGYVVMANVGPGMVGNCLLGKFG